MYIRRKWIVGIVTSCVPVLLIATVIWFRGGRSRVRDEGMPYPSLTAFLRELNGWFSRHDRLASTNSMEDVLRQIAENEELKSLVKRSGFRQSWQNGHLVDPWGQDMQWTNSLKCVYSIGPNGVDEHCGGDDIYQPSGWYYRKE